jgi:hypothetical protein
MCTGLEGNVLGAQGRCGERGLAVEAPREAKRKIVGAMGRRKAAEGTDPTTYRLEHGRTMLGDDVVIGHTHGAVRWRPMWFS